MTTTNSLIRSAKSADVPILAKIFADAFAADRHTQLKALGEDSKASAQAMASALYFWIADGESYSVLQVTDSTSGEVVGWACWRFHGFAKPPTSASLSSRQNGREANEQQDKSGRDEVIVDLEAGNSYDIPTTLEDKSTRLTSGEVAKHIESSANQTVVERIEAITNKDMARWKRILMPLASTKCMILVAIAVAPAYQSRGIGSALIDWGIAEADTAGVFIWVHASEAGHKLFEKHGFEVIGILDLNLDDFANDMVHNGGRSQWGHYKFRYMKRLPK